MIHEKLTGQKMKRVCEERGLTVQEIQKRLGIGAHQSVYNWFNGRSMPTLDNYYSLCKMLGVEMESLIVETDEREEDLLHVEAPAEPVRGTCIFWTDSLADWIGCLGRAEWYRRDYKARYLLSPTSL